MTRHARFLGACLDQELDDDAVLARNCLRQGSGLTLGCYGSAVDCN